MFFFVGGYSLILINYILIPKGLGEGDECLRESNYAHMYESIRKTLTALHSTYELLGVHSSSSINLSNEKISLSKISYWSKFEKIIEQLFL